MKSKPNPINAALKAALAWPFGRARAAVLLPACAPFCAPALFALLLAAAAPAPAQTFSGAPLPPADLPNLPNLGDAARDDLSPLHERQIGEEIMRDIRGDRDYLDDAPILEYLNDFGKGLVAARPDVRGETNFDFFFFCVRDPQLNAFALPGGFIAVHSALLLAAQSESELASVMAHEIGHVAQRHIARSIGEERKDAMIPLAAMILAVLASRAGGDAAMGVLMGGEGIAIQRQLNFSRDAEREADRIGFQIMGAAGFDTNGMVAFFQRLQSASRSYSDFAPPWLLTHPLTTERIADIQARIREQPYKQRVDSLDFYLVRARARVLQDESGQGLHDAAEFFANQMLQQNRQQTAAAEYGMAFIALKKGDLAAAQSWLDKARDIVYKQPSPGTFSMAKMPLPDAIFASMALDIHMAPGQPKAMAQQALKEAEAAYGQFPFSRGIAHQYAEAMIAAGHSEDAAGFLREQVQLYKEEPKLYDLLAKAYAAQGKLTLQHMALAESYVRSGASGAAVDQLNIARKSPDSTFYDMSVIDARERELETQRKEKLKEQGKDTKDTFQFKMDAGTASDGPFSSGFNNDRGGSATKSEAGGDPFGDPFANDPLHRNRPVPMP
ncbi:MAG TPA: M48 family metalloprotease [Janthinobacterium sp.]|nr:M48 family metalloprotease [Janthinobacterium sp.]